jgi:hypothetical protein
VPAGRVAEYVPDGFNALLAEHFHEAGDALALYLFEGLQVLGSKAHHFTCHYR